MPEEYTENEKKKINVEYKIAKELIEPPIDLKTENEMETYKAKTENTVSSENIQKPEIKREGDKRCWCGSGKKFEDCHGKHLRVDKNPGASVKGYEHELNVRSIDEYDTPESEKEYEAEERMKEEDSEKGDSEKEVESKYEKKEKEEDEEES
jgi:hypothetical protein